MFISIANVIRKLIINDKMKTVFVQRQDFHIIREEKTVRKIEKSLINETLCGSMMKA